MARSASLTVSTSVTRLALGFVAGFLAVLTFHQIGLWLLHLGGITPGTPWSANPVPPFGVPQILSFAFWGGVWGIVFVLVEPYLARCPGGYWVGATLFGAIFPTLALWLIVIPLKGGSVAAVFIFPRVIVGPIIHALWGLGTGLFLGVLTGWRNQPR